MILPGPPGITRQCCTSRGWLPPPGDRSRKADRSKLMLRSTRERKMVQASGQGRWLQLSFPPRWTSLLLLLFSLPLLHRFLLHLFSLRCQWIFPGSWNSCSASENCKTVFLLEADCFSFGKRGAPLAPLVRWFAGSGKAIAFLSLKMDGTWRRSGSLAPVLHT